MSAPRPFPLSEDQQRRARVALAASVLLHLLLVMLFFRIHPWTRRPQRLETVDVRQTISFEKKRVEPRRTLTPRHAAVVPHPVLQAAAPQAPVRKAPPVARSKSQPHELAKVTPRALPHVRSLRPAPTVAAPGKVPAARPQLSGQQLAQIQTDLGNSIAQDRQRIDPLQVPPAAAPTMKHYDADYTALATGERHGGGLCDPIKSWTDDGYDYYYVACNVRFSDGTVERQGVPWPIRFVPNDDPFNGTAHDRERPIAMPLPGWHLGPGETITAFMRSYAKSHGVDI